MVILNKKGKSHSFDFAKRNQTTVSLAKAIYHLSQPFEHRKPFSMADIKTQYSNELIWNLIIQACGISSHEPKIIKIRKVVLSFGTIRA